MEMADQMGLYFTIKPLKPSFSMMILFSYLTDFSCFPLKIIFRKLLDMVRTNNNKDL